MGQAIRLLLIEDNEDDSLLLLRTIKNGGIEPSYARVTTEAELRAQLVDKQWDIVISDFNLGGFDGLSALRIVKNENNELPFILVSGTVGESIAVEAMKSGAQDYIMKSNMTRLAPAIARELAESERRKESKRQLAKKEEEIRQVQKMELIGQISGGLAHDFNNILGVIGLYSEQIAATIKDPVLQKCLQGIGEAQKKGSALVRQLLTIGRKHNPELKVFDLNEVIKSLKDILSVGLGRKNELVFQLSPDAVFIDGDPSQMEQVLMNFIVNARDAIEEAGRVTIETRLKDKNAYLTVTDTGSGMDEATLKRIFEPFFTTKDVGKGSGMGLATVFAIIKQHKGDIEVSSQVGQGTAFRIRFPLVEERENDVTKKAEPARDSDFKLLFEKSHSACLVLTPQFDIVAVTDAYLKATMTTREQMIGRALFEVFPDNPDDKTATGTSNLRASLERVLQLKKSDTMAVQKYDIRKDGSGEFEERHWSPINSPLCDDGGRVKFILHTVVDVTGFVTKNSNQAELEIVKRAQDLQELNKQLRLSEDRFRLLVDSIQDYAIVTLDKNGHITSWSSGAAKCFLYSAEEVMGKPVTMLSGDVLSNETPREIRLALAAGRYEEEGWRVRSDGTRFWGNVVVAPIYAKDRTLIGFVKVVRNLTERKNHEDMLKRLTEDLTAQAAALKDVNTELETFCYSVSHDLRAPLRSLNGFSQALLEDYGTKIDDQATNYLNRIANAAKYMGELIDGLLRLSRVGRQPLNRESLHLSTLVQNIANEINGTAGESNATVSIEENLVANGDPLLLRAALFNLVSNAFKFSRKTPNPKIEFGRKIEDGKPIFYIKDNGAGFDMRYKDKLFGPFQRLHSATDFDGTGIGLATVQRIIRRHGGDIWADGEIGRGATFYFTL